MNDFTASSRQRGDWTFLKFDQAWLLMLVIGASCVALAVEPSGGAWLAVFALMAAPSALELLPVWESHRGRHIRRSLVWCTVLALAITIAGPHGTSLVPVAILAATGIARRASRNAWRDAVLFCLTGTGIGTLAATNAPPPTGVGAAALVVGGLAIIALLGKGGMVIRDMMITRRRLTRDLAEKTAILSASPAVHLTLNSAGAVVDAHGPLPDMLGLTPSEIEGLQLEDLVDETSRAALARMTVAAASSEHPTVINSAILSRPVRLTYCSDARTGRARVGITHATIEPAEVERLKAARDMAIDSAASKSKFFAQLNHELRTPLNAILGFSDVIRQRVFGPMPDQYGEYIEHINDSATHLLELVGSVIDLSKLEAGAYQLERERHDARDAMTAAVAMLGVLAEKKSIQLIDTSPTSPIMVDADPRALRQVAINLIANAIKFTPKDGRVEASVSAANGMMIMEVKDNGPGIGAAELANLGNPYVQTQTGRTSSEPGSGLGLAIVRGFAQMHDGDLIARSKLGEGATIGITAPVLATGDEGGDATRTRTRTV